MKKSIWILKRFMDGDAKIMPYAFTSKEEANKWADAHRHEGLAFYRPIELSVVALGSNSVLGNGSS